MTATAGKVLMVAPFWRLTSHVGVYRVERFVRWLHNCGLEIVLVRAGTRDLIEPTPWGTEISIRDPIRLYLDPDGPPAPAWRRGRSRLRRLAALALFSPDPTIVWARRASRHPAVLAHAAGARWVMASSPPESVHVAAALLAARLGAKLLVDLRDGWLDEPNKPFVGALPFRRWHESRLESRSLLQADRVLVTSEGWRRQLVQRRPAVAPKVHVLTNGYPTAAQELEPESTASERRVSAAPGGVLELVYTGQFTYSRSTQRPKLLLEPLWLAAQRGGSRARIELVGNMSPQDLEEIDTWKERLATVGWTVNVHPQVSRADALARLRQAAGLLLLSASEAAIPSKTFEYLPTGRPILTVTSRTGALWELSREMPQVFLTDYLYPERSLPEVSAFLKACADHRGSYPIPERFTDRFLSKRFLEILELSQGDLAR